MLSRKLVFLVLALALPAAILFAQPRPIRRAAAFYGIDSAGRLLFIDASTYAETLLGPLGIAGIGGLAYDSSADVLYGVSRGGTLVQIDRTTGAATAVHRIVAEGQGTFSALAFEAGGGGRLYTVNLTGLQELFRIDLATRPPIVTKIRPTGAQITGLALQSSTRKLYAIHRNRNALGILDAATGAFTLVHPNAQINNPENIAFTASETLVGAFTPGTLGVFDLATGKATRVARTTTTGALAFVPETGKEPPRPNQVGVEVPASFETPHPYGTTEIQSIVIQHSGATYIAPHFARFELGPDDFVIVRAPDGSRAWHYENTGKGELGRTTGFWAGHIAGDTAIIDFYRRGWSSTAYGFKIDRYARGYTSEEQAGAGLAGVETICGADDSKNARCYQTSDPLVYGRGRPVARLLINGTAACTGWLFGSQGHLLTNHHCIGSAADAQNTDVEFLAEGACSTNCASPFGCQGTTVASSTQLVRLSAALDYALVQLGQPVLPTTYGYLQARTTGALIGERLYIPQHPAAWGKRLAVTSTAPQDSSGFVQVFNRTTPPCYGDARLDVGYYGDTQQGSSGSPVIAYSDHLVVALHHCGGCPNGGVPIEAIVNDLGSDLPQCARGTDLGCPNPGITTTSLPPCANCTNSAQCSPPATCIEGKCIASDNLPIGSTCCGGLQCASRRCGAARTCECNSSVDCPSGQSCAGGECREARADCTGCLFGFQCASGRCAGLRCATAFSLGLGQNCCRDLQCVSGSCGALNICQCDDSGDCPSGWYCNKGLLTVGANFCDPLKGPCEPCSADRQCGQNRRCDGKPLGRCITGSENLPLGASCCRGDQCRSGSCTVDNGKCQCKVNGDCPAGQYCSLGFLGVGKNKCVAYKAECDSCTADKQCGPGAHCVFSVDGGRCASSLGLPKNAACCRGRQCASGFCKPNRKCSG